MLGQGAENYIPAFARERDLTSEVYAMHVNHWFYKRNHFSLISALILHSYPIHSPLKRFMATHASLLNGQLRTPWNNCLLNSMVAIYLDHRILPLYCALEYLMTWFEEDGYSLHGIHISSGTY